MIWKVLLPVAILASSSNAQHFMGDLRLLMTDNDFQIGLQAGRESVLKGVSLDFFLELSGNTYVKTVRVRDTANLVYQFHEYRFYLGPGMAASFPVSDLGYWIFAAGTDLSLADYRGSLRSPPDYWDPWGETGFRFSLKKHGFLGIGVRYQPTLRASAYRAALDLGIHFNPEME